MITEVNSVSGHSAPSYSPSNCSSKISKIFNQRVLQAIGASVVGASFGSMLGIMVTVISVPTPAERADQYAVLFTGAGIGAGIGSVFASTMHYLYGAKIIECLIKVCPKKCCQKFNDGHLQAPIIEENL